MMASSPFVVAVDQEACTGCETCVERCEMNATKMNDDGLSETNMDRCIGCGLCVTTCPEQARQLIPKPGEEHRKPSFDTPDQMNRLARKRGFKDIDPSRVVSFGF